MASTGQGPAAFKAFMQKEIERWGKVVKENGISAGS
jgi:tripartite-type tricarboxylate transporter receptor subunit TctC